MRAPRGALVVSGAYSVVPVASLTAHLAEVQHDQNSWAPAVLGTSQLSRPCSRAMMQGGAVGLCYRGECGFAFGRQWVLRHAGAIGG